MRLGVSQLARQTTAEPLPDQILLDAVRAGEPGSLERLLTPHEQPLYRFCLGVLRSPDDAEDAVQEAFIRAIRALPGFRGRSALRTWLIRIALNVCLEWKRGARPTEPLDARTPCSSPSPDGRTIDRLRAEEALASLRPQQRAVIVLKEAEGLSVQEIGDVMGWSRKKAEHELYFARKALAEWRASQEED